MSKALSLPHWRYPAIPVVLRDSSEVLPAPDAVRCSVYGYLSKPFRAEELELMLIRLNERRASQLFEDAVSGLYYSARFAVIAQQQLETARRTKTDMILLRTDVDGRTVEQVERAIAELGLVVQQTFRDADLASRVDGTDCGVLLVVHWVRLYRNCTGALRRRGLAWVSRPMALGLLSDEIRRTISLENDLSPAEADADPVS